MAEVWVCCAGCGTRFAKRAAEVRRQRRRNPDAEFFCSRQCYAQHRGRKNLGSHLGVGDASHLDAGNRQDEFSPFRYFMRKARLRKYETDLDLEFLRDLWRSQRGRCALSGVDMDLPPNSLAWERRVGDPWKPSLDRIDSTRGYLKGNVRYVAVIGNLAKAGFTDDELLYFCRAVVAFRAEE